MPYECGAGAVELDIDGQRYSYRVHKLTDTWLVHGPAGDLELKELPRYPVPGAEELSGGLVAPMPGAVLATEISVGDVVAKGDLLLILEAMKMEHRITAPMDGTIEELHVRAGDQVENGQLLVTLSDGKSDGKSEGKSEGNE
jgi:propionyl-CoA carboxylase alpha chain